MNIITFKYQQLIQVIHTLGVIISIGVLSVTIKADQVKLQYTLDTALERIETHGELSKNLRDNMAEANAAVMGAESLNNSVITMMISTGVYQKWDRFGLEEPNLPSKYKDLEPALFNRDFTFPRVSGKIGLTKPIWDGGLIKAARQQAQSNKKRVQWSHHQQLIEQKKELISLYFAYQSLMEEFLFLTYKRDNLSQLISEKVPSKKTTNTSQELLFKKNILEYEEALFLLSQVEQKKHHIYYQILVMLGHHPDENIILQHVTTAEVQKVPTNNDVLQSPEERLANEAYTYQLYSIKKLKAQQSWKVNFNSFYEHNVLSNQIIGGEFQIMFPIKRSGLIKAEIKAEVANLSHIERQMKIMQQHQDYKRQQLKKEIDVLNQQLTLTHRRRQLADQKWQLNKKSFQEGLATFEASFNSELGYRKALLLFKKIKYMYLEKVYHYNEVMKGTMIK